jgi:YqaJ-like viral recombinase domain
MKTFLMEQGSSDWFEARKGRPTASEFKRILPAGGGLPFCVLRAGEEVSNHRTQDAAEKAIAKRVKKEDGPFEIVKRLLGGGAKSYMAQLIGEIMSTIPPERVESYTNNAMRWGAETEAEARHFFTMDTGLTVQQVGGCLDDSGRFWSSPDGIIEVFQDNTGAITGCADGLELKCPLATTQAEYLLDAPAVPAEYIGQVHGAMIVTGAKRWHFMSYSPGLPAMIVVEEANEYTDRLRDALEEFWSAFQQNLLRIRGTQP